MRQSHGSVGQSCSRPAPLSELPMLFEAEPKLLPLLCKVTSFEGYARGSTYGGSVGSGGASSSVVGSQTQTGWPP
jgi:hypothetical protein